MKKLAAIAAIFALTAQPVAAEEASVVCMYEILTSSHAASNHCGQPLDAAAEARYQKLISEIAAFIVNNTPAMQGKINAATFHAQRVKRKEDAIRQNAAACQNTTIIHFIKTLRSAVSEEAVKKYSEFLKTPSDPSKGICL